MGVLQNVTTTNTILPSIALPAIAFAHNTAFNSAINCTPFEAGHDLQARTITEARAGPRLQIVAEGGMDLLEADTNWEKSLFPIVLRLASEAQRQSQWHKRMNAHNLNQSGSKVEDKGLSPGDRAHFYKPLGLLSRKLGEGAAKPST
jgi:hypothetical protein